jgi:MFS family permease
MHGRFFDTLGRKIMISGTYVLSGELLAVTAWLFDQGTLNAITQTAAWVIIFFFASAGASSAYLTVSEIFPMEAARWRSRSSTPSAPRWGHLRAGAPPSL